MPELPEVETVVRDLRPLLVGKKIASIRSSGKKLRQSWEIEWNRSVVNRPISRIKRRGKWIQIFLQNDSMIALHLGMTGQLTVHPSKEDLADHVHLRFGLDSGEEELRFRDIRRFGSALYFKSEAKWYDALDEKLGPEPFDLQPRPWAEALQQSTRVLKALLLDQQLVAGIGNIYADESLFIAGLHPKQTGKNTTAAQAEKLREAIVQVLTRAINSRGSTIRNYVGGSGLQGEYQGELFVYGRTGEPCTRCQTPIEQIRIGGRGTHFCPVCQQK